MARKTFISYKYSDVVAGASNNLRDRIIAKLGEDAKFYRGEDGYTKDLSSYSAAYIKETLKKMIRDTSVTILILSPNMKLSQWMNGTGIIIFFILKSQETEEHLIQMEL